MPAAIRIDIHMGSFGGLAAERSESRDQYLQTLAEKLAEAVRACIMENTNDPQDEIEGSLTGAGTVRPRIKPGLGDPWPPHPESSEPELLFQEAPNMLANLAEGKWSGGLMREQAYDDGSRYIYFSCDFG